MTALDGRVALITGVARGIGRATAVRLARAGADVIGVDICRDIKSVPYELASEDDLTHTARLVGDLGQTASMHIADVRDRTALRAAVSAGVRDVGEIDIVVANAGIWSFDTDVFADEDVRLREWHDAIDVMQTGVLNTLDAVVPQMVDRGAGGSIVIMSSAAGLRANTRDYAAGSGGRLGYVAAKHAVVGLMRCYAKMLGDHRIRVNTLHPSGVDSPMIRSQAFRDFARSPGSTPGPGNLLPVEILDVEDLANAATWLSSDEARYVTGTTFVVDAGQLLQ